MSYYANCPDWHSIAYKKGWKAGYYDVLNGGCGCPPVFAPECYAWPIHILKDCDQPRNDWYTGFQDGAACAKLMPDTHYLKPWMPPATGFSVSQVSLPQTVIIEDEVPPAAPPVPGSHRNSEIPAPPEDVEPADVDDAVEPEGPADDAAPAQDPNDYEDAFEEEALEDPAAAYLQSAELPFSAPAPWLRVVTPVSGEKIASNIQPL